MALGDAKASATIRCVVCTRLSQSICLNIRLARFMSCKRDVQKIWHTHNFTRYCFLSWCHHSKPDRLSIPFRSSPCSWSTAGRRSRRVSYRRRRRHSCSSFPSPSTAAFSGDLWKSSIFCRLCRLRFPKVRWTCDSTYDGYELVSYRLNAESIKLKFPVSCVKSQPPRYRFMWTPCLREAQVRSRNSSCALSKSFLPYSFLT